MQCDLYAWQRIQKRKRTPRLCHFRCGGCASAFNGLTLNVQGGDMTQTVQLLTNNQFQVIAATPEQVARLKPRIQLVQDGQYIVSLLFVCLLILLTREKFVFKRL